MASTELEQLQAENAKLRGQLADLQQRLVESQKLGAVGALASSMSRCYLCSLARDSWYLDEWRRFWGQIR